MKSAYVSRKAKPKARSFLKNSCNRIPVGCSDRLFDMRGDDKQLQSGMFSYVSLEDRVPQDHPLRAIRRLVDQVLTGMSKEFDRLYSDVGRPSIPPERLLRALLLQVFYS